MASCMAADTYPLYDRLLDGKLGDVLLGWRDEGIKNPEIAYRLRSEHEIVVSTETVRRWLHKLEKEAAA